MNKKAIAILGGIFILIVGTLGFLIFSKYSNKGNQTAQTGTPNIPGNNSGTIPAGSNAGNGGTTPGNGGGVIPASSTPVTTPPSSSIVKLTDDQVMAPALFYNGQGITYFDNQGNLYQSSLDSSGGQLQLSNKKQLAIPIKSNITNILWPSKGSDFIAQYTDPSGKTAWSYFNNITQQYTNLPPQVVSVDWMPNGTQIMYIWLENGKATLNISNPDTSDWKYLADMWETDDEIHVSPDGSQVLYFETNGTLPNNAINSVTVDGKIWKGLVKNGQNLGVLWSPDGQKFLFGKKDLNSQGYQLWIYNLTSGEVKNLAVLTTPQKALWSSDSNVVYVAVPSSGTAGGNGLTSDSFFKINTTTLEKKQYSSGLSSAIDARNLFLNATADKLIFKNAQNGGLYYLDLNQQ